MVVAYAVDTSNLSIGYVVGGLNRPSSMLKLLAVKSQEYHGYDYF